MVRRMLGAVVALAVAVALFVVTWPQFFQLQRAVGVAQVSSLRGAVVLAAVLTAVVLVLIALLSPAARRLCATVAVLLLASAAVNGVVLVSRGLGAASFQTATENDVTVLSWNTLGDAVSVEDIVRLAVDSGADIVALPETTDDVADAVAAGARAEGLPLHAWTVAYDDVAKARSTSLLISSELGQYVVDEAAASTSVLPSVVATPTSGEGPVIVAVHAVAPVGGEMANWRKDLRWLSRQCDGANIILAGDFNATLDHFSGLAADDEDDETKLATTDLGGCLDAARVTKNAAVGTWPTAVPALIGAPIDHVLATANWATTGFRVLQNRDGDGSDHRPVLAQLSPAG